MITLNLDWREVLWWMQGGMAGSHLRWSVYEDMVNKVWPQCSEQEQRNLWLIMRRDLGSCWRPDGWSGYRHMNDKGEGEWKPENEISDKTPWMYFRQVLARFDPENQYAVTMKTEKWDDLYMIYDSLPKYCVIGNLSSRLKVRAYKWQNEYRIDWNRRCAEDAIVKAEKIDIPDTN